MGRQRWSEQCVCCWNVEVGTFKVEWNIDIEFWCCVYVVIIIVIVIVAVVAVVIVVVVVVVIIVHVFRRFHTAVIFFLD